MVFIGDKYYLLSYDIVYVYQLNKEGLIKLGSYLVNDDVDNI